MGPVLTIPNLITFARLGLVPVFIWLKLAGRPDAAMICFAVAMGSDAIDGLLARLLNQRSKLGAVLDPLADKLLVASALVLLVVDGSLPVWLLSLILLRDGLIAIGALMVRRKKLDLPAQPSRIGKYATFSMAALVVLALGAQTSVAPSAAAPYTWVVGLLAGLCVVISTGQYLARFGHLFFAPPRRA